MQILEQAGFQPRHISGRGWFDSLGMGAFRSDEAGHLGPDPAFVGTSTVGVSTAIDGPKGEAPAGDFATSAKKRRGVAVLATPSDRQAPIAAGLMVRGFDVVSTADGLRDVGDLLGLHALGTFTGTSLVIGAAFSPGISSLLAKWLAQSFDEVSEISIASFGTGGPSCARSRHSAFSRFGYQVLDSELVKVRPGSGRQLVFFPEPAGGNDCFFAAFPEPLLLHRSLPNVPKIQARMAGTRRDRLTMRLPMLRPPHPEGLIGALSVEVRGRKDGQVEHRLVAVSIPQSSGAAVAAALAVEKIFLGDFPKGCSNLADLGNVPKSIEQISAHFPLLTYGGTLIPSKSTVIQTARKPF